LIFYGIGNFINGIIGDAYPPRLVVSVGLLISTICYLVVIYLANAGMAHFAIFALIWMVNGYAQSTVCPCSISLLTNWFERENRGKIMGFFGASSSTGNMSGAVLAGLISAFGMEWEFPILLSCSFTLLIIALFSLLVEDKTNTDAQEDET